MYIQRKIWKHGKFVGAKPPENLITTCDSRDQMARLLLGEKMKDDTNDTKEAKDKGRRVSRQLQSKCLREHPEIMSYNDFGV